MLRLNKNPDEYINEYQIGAPDTDDVEIVTESVKQKYLDLLVAFCAQEFEKNTSFLWVGINRLFSQ